MKFILFLLWTMATPFILCNQAALADEENSSSSKPSIFFDRLFFQPEAQINEPSQGGPGPLLWAVGLKSGFSQWTDIRVSVGSPQMVFLPYWAATNNNFVSLLDGVGTIHGSVGDLYAGQFLVPWGIEGTTEEENLFFPRTLLYQNGQFPLRDIGAGFKTDFDGYYMNVAAHSGVGPNQSSTDNRVFVTGQFGYKGAAHSNVGISLTEGRVAQPFLTPEMKMRGGNAFFGFHIFGLGLQIEGSYFQTINQNLTADILAWHADIEHPISNSINIMARYEQLNPNILLGANVLGRGYIGGEWHSQDNVSRFFLFGIKNNESQQEVPNDGILAIWRFTPPTE